MICMAMSGSGSLTFSGLTPMAENWIREVLKQERKISNEEALGVMLGHLWILEEEEMDPLKASHQNLASALP